MRVLTLFVALVLLSGCAGGSDQATERLPSQTDGTTETRLPTPTVFEDQPEPTEVAPTTTAVPSESETPVIIAAEPTATATVLPTRPRLEGLEAYWSPTTANVDGLEIIVDEVGLWSRQLDSPWNLLPLPEGVSRANCSSSGPGGVAITAHRASTSQFSILEASLSTGSWTQNVFEIDAFLVSCPVYGADGAIYVVLVTEWNDPTGLQVLRLTNGAVSKRILLEGVKVNRVEIHRDGDDLVVGYCQASDLYPCARELIRVDPAQFFGDAEFSVDDSCPAVEDGSAVCAYDFTVPIDGYLGSVGDKLWLHELHETLGNFVTGEWDIPFGRWAAGPFAATPAPFPTGFGVDLFEHGSGVVARVPLTLRTPYVQPEYRWYGWDTSTRTWQAADFAPHEIREIERNFTPIPGNRGNWLGTS